MSICQKLSEFQPSSIPNLWACITSSWFWQSCAWSGLRRSSKWSRALRGDLLLLPGDPHQVPQVLKINNSVQRSAEKMRHSSEMKSFNFRRDHFSPKNFWPQIFSTRILFSYYYICAFSWHSRLMLTIDLNTVATVLRSMMLTWIFLFFLNELFVRLLDQSNMFLITYQVRSFPVIIFYGIYSTIYLATLHVQSNI